MEGRIALSTTGIRPLIRVRSARVMAAVMAPRRTVRPQRSSLIAGLMPFSPTSLASSAGTPNRRSSASTYLRTCCLSTATRTSTLSPLSDRSALETASSTSGSPPSLAGATCRSLPKRNLTGCANSAHTRWRACPTSSPDTLSPAMRTLSRMRF